MAGVNPIGAKLQGPRRNRVALILLLVMLAAAVGAVPLFGLVAATAEMSSVGENMLRAIRDENYEQAYELCAPEFRRQLGGAARLAGLAGSRKLVRWQMSSWKLRNTWNLDSRDDVGLL